MSGRKFRSRPIASGNFGNPEGVLHSGAFFFGYFLLGKQKKVTSRRATPGIGVGKTDMSALSQLHINRQNTLRYSALRALFQGHDIAVSPKYTCNLSELLLVHLHAVDVGAAEGCFGRSFHDYANEHFGLSHF
jgi:hypothetical protein